MAFHDRIGRFEVSLQLIDEAPHLVQRLMSQCVIIKANEDIARGTIAYIAYHNQFDEIEKTAEIPAYTFSFNNLTGVWTLDEGAIIEVESA
jgi:hypothetical protein